MAAYMFKLSGIYVLGLLPLARLPQSRFSSYLAFGQLSLGRIRLSKLLQDLCDITFLSDEKLFIRIPTLDRVVLRVSEYNPWAWL